MTKVFPLIVASFLIAGAAGLTLARGEDERLDLAKFASHPETFAGRIVEVSANLVAINADGKSLELFDSQSHTRISVRLSQLRKAERLALMRSDVRRVSVSGRASAVGGRLIIDAQSIQPLPLKEGAEVQS